MATVDGIQILEVTDGGSANGGQDTWIELELFEGRTKFKKRFFLDREKFSFIVQALLHFGGMARAQYLKRNPAAEGDAQLGGAYAPPIAEVFSGIAAQPGIAILAFQAGAADRPMNLHLSANANALRKTIANAQARLADLESNSPPDPKLKIH
jgi:hypothetical protein